MQIQTELLLRELLDLTENSIHSVKKFKSLSPFQLNYKKSPTEWSILECIEHLNLYGDFYLPEMEKQILASKACTKSYVFKSGLIGNYFANLMKANNGKIKKMKSPSDKNPLNSTLTLLTLDRFLKQQELLKLLLDQAKSIDLVKTKTSISLSKFIKLRLGDTFRFYVFHIERHILQSERAAEY